MIYRYFLTIVLSLVIVQALYTQEIAWVSVSDSISFASQLLRGNDDTLLEIYQSADNTFTLRKIDTTGALIWEINPCSCDSLRLDFSTETTDGSLLSIYRNGDLYLQSEGGPSELAGNFIPDSITGALTERGFHRFEEDIYFYINSNIKETHLGKISVEDLGVELNTLVDTKRAIYYSQDTNEEGEIVYLYYRNDPVDGGYQIRKTSGDFSEVWKEQLPLGVYWDVAFSGDDIVAVGRKQPGLNGVAVKLNADGMILNELIFTPPNNAIVVELFDVILLNGTTFITGYAQYSGIVQNSVLYILNPSFEVEREGIINFGGNEDIISDVIAVGMESNSIYVVGGTSTGDSEVPNHALRAKIGVTAFLTALKEAAAVSTIPIALYPNPVESTLYVGLGDDRYDLTIYSLSGTVVRTFHAANSADFSGLPAGNYVVSMRRMDDGTIRIGKVTKR